MKLTEENTLTVVTALAAVSSPADRVYGYERSEKPVIYLYPEQAQEVSVQLELDGEASHVLTRSMAADGR